MDSKWLKPGKQTIPIGGFFQKIKEKPSLRKAAIATGNNVTTYQLQKKIKSMEWRWSGSRKKIERNNQLCIQWKMKVIH